MRYRMLLLALAIWTSRTPVDAAAPTPSCATVTVRSESYAEITAPDFRRRVFLYVPNVRAVGSTGFKRFRLWVVEGVYSRPFVRSTGSFASADFTRLRTSRNLRSTPIWVRPGNQSNRGTFSFGRKTYQVQVVEVTVGKAPSVRVRVCP